MMVAFGMTYSIWSPVSRHEDLRCGLIFEVRGKLIDALFTLDLLIICVRDDRLILNSHALDGFRDTLRCCLLAVFRPDLLLLQLLNLGNSAILHFQGQSYLLPFVLVFDHLRLHFDFLSFVVRLSHCFDAFIKFGQGFHFPPLFK